MVKERTTRSGPQLPKQIKPDTSILNGGEESPERERGSENKYGVPRDVPGKTPGGKVRHHCPKRGHTSDLHCLKKGCMIKCPDCGIQISRFSGAKCRACQSAEEGRKREEKIAKEAKKKADAKLVKKGKMPAPQSGCMAKMLLAPHPAGIRKRTGRVGERASSRFSRRSQDVVRRPAGLQFDKNSVECDEMDENEDEWEDLEDNERQDNERQDNERQDNERQDNERQDNERQDNNITADEARRRMEEDAALLLKIRESLLKLLS